MTGKTAASCSVVSASPNFVLNFVSTSSSPLKVSAFETKFETKFAGRCYVDSLSLGLPSRRLCGKNSVNMSSEPTATPRVQPSDNLSLRIAILCKRSIGADEQLARQIESYLAAKGCRVFLDRHAAIGVDWARQIERELRSADAVIVLLSAASIQSEMLCYEVEIASEAGHQQDGRPQLIPIRVNYDGAIPEILSGILAPFGYHQWRGSQDDGSLTTNIGRLLESMPPRAAAPPVEGRPLRLAPRAAAAPRPIAGAPTPGSTFVFKAELEPIGGAVPLSSKFYITRKVDDELRGAIARGDSIVLIKGARQMGKTSLLARGLQQARERGAKVALTDCQKLNRFHLESVQNFFFYLAESVAEQLDMAPKPEEVWDERRGASVNFERYLRREVLKNLNAHLVWGLDEVDRLFACEFGGEVFGLFRSWHNERALDPAGPWAGLTLAIAYATEAHLFITDMNQSPFNVGTRLAMEDFTFEQVMELNRRYGSPLSDAEQVGRFVRLVRGHPFLVRRGFHEIVTQKLDIEQFEELADRDDGIFGDHLRRILILLAKDPALLEIVRGVLCGRPCPTPESFYRLRSAGVVAGTSPADAHPRCEIYAAFLKRHLLEDA